MNIFAPSWVKSGAKFDLDFANERYWGQAVSRGSIFNRDTLVFPQSNGVDAYVPDRNGIIRKMLANFQCLSIGRGLWVEQAKTNGLLWNRDLTQTAWVKVTMTTAKNQVGADLAANSATLLTASALNATVLQTTVFGSTQYVSSAYVKRVTGSGSVFITQDGGSTYTDITSLLSTTAYTLVSCPAATLAAPVVGFKIATNGDAIAVDFAQLEAGAYPTSPILTTTATVNRGNCEPGISDPSLIRPNNGQLILTIIFDTKNPWSVYAEYSGNPIVGTGWLIASDATPSMSGGCNGGAFTFQGATSGSSGTFGLDNINKVAGTINGNGAKSCINGGTLGTSANKVPNTIPTHCGLGNNGAGTAPGPINGYIGRLAFWNREITDGQMIEFTR